MTKRIDPYYFANLAKPHTVTAEDFDLIIQHCYENRELVSKVIENLTGTEFSWKTDLSYARSWIKMFGNGQINAISEKFMDSFMAYNAETRDAIVLVGGLTYEGE